MKKNTCIIVQNQTDKDLVLALTSKNTDVVLISGSGVNFDEFRFKAYQRKANIVLFSGRILRDKGIVEFVEACRILHQEFPSWQFLVLGTADYANPSGLSKKQFLSLISGTPLKWLGYVSNPKKIVRNAKIVCLPSYREGLSKVLVEAAATGSCIVTTNAPGCRDVVTHKKNGFLVEVGDIQDLASALREAMSDEVFSEKMAQNAFNDAMCRFSIEEIVKQNLDCFFEDQFNE